jgi:hypothetical protein
MHENILARLTLNKAVALTGIEPLHSSLFLHFWFLVFGKLFDASGRQ